MNRSRSIPRSTGRHSQRGQGMTEYIVVVALVAVAAIGVYSAFGDAHIHEVSAISHGLAGMDGQGPGLGTTTSAIDSAIDSGFNATNDADAANGVGMSTYTLTDTEQTDQ